MTYTRIPPDPNIHARIAEMKRLLLMPGMASAPPVVLAVLQRQLGQLEDEAAGRSYWCVPISDESSTN